jgi:hypothetical protein
MTSGTDQQREFRSRYASSFAASPE